MFLCDDSGVEILLENLFIRQQVLRPRTSTGWKLHGFAQMKD